MLDEHWAAAEADWQQYYGADLAEAVYGKEGMTVRRIVGLTLSLPAESRTMRAVSGGNGWSSTDTLVGLAVERLDALHYALVKVNGGKADKPQPLVPRPKRRPVTVSTQEALASLDLMLAGGDR